MSYLTTIDWQTSNAPVISEASPRKSVSVSYNLSDNPVPHGSGLTINSLLVLPYIHNTTIATSYTNAYLSYPPPASNLLKSGFSCSLYTPEIMCRDANDPNISGGYVIGAFSIFSDPGGQNTIAEYRFCSEYSYFQDPEEHTLTLTPLDIPEPTWVGNFCFGHSYGLLTDKQLWDFSEWMTQDQNVEQFEPPVPINKQISWPDLLPYPQGENYIAPPPPAKCGDPGTEYLPGDFNHDCYVNFEDFAYFAQNWLGCTNPTDSNCESY